MTKKVDKQQKVAIGLLHQIEGQLKAGKIQVREIAPVLDAILRGDFVCSGNVMRIDPVMLLRAFKIPVFTPEDTERRFNVSFTEVEKEKLRQKTISLISIMLLELENHGVFTLSELNDQKAYIVVDPSGLSVADMINAVGASSFVEGQFTRDFWFERENFYYGERTQPGVALRFAWNWGRDKTYWEQGTALQTLHQEKGLDFTNRPTLCEELVGWLMFTNAKTEQYPFWRTQYRTDSISSEHQRVIIGTQDAGGIIICKGDDESRKHNGRFPVGVDRCYKLYI